MDALAVSKSIAVNFKNKPPDLLMANPLFGRAKKIVKRRNSLQMIYHYIIE
jgi:hypothetical protein